MTKGEIAACLITLGSRLATLERAIRRAWESHKCHDEDCGFCTLFQEVGGKP